MSTHVTTWIVEHGWLAVFALMAVDAVLPAGGELHGRWLHVGPGRFARAESWFARYGSVFVFVGRLTPLVRSFVSIPAGVLEFALRPYVVLSGAASLVWCVAFGTAGYVLGTHWDAIHDALGYAALAAALLRPRLRAF